MKPVEQMFWVVSGDVSQDTLGLVSKGAALAMEQGLRCCAILAASELRQEQQAALSSAGADHILHLRVDQTIPGSELTVQKALTRLARERKPEAILFLSSLFFGTVAPAIAAALETGITADCTQLLWGPDGTLLQSRPTYGGRMLATIRTRTRPVMATVRRGIFRDINAADRETAAVECIDLSEGVPCAFSRLSEQIEKPPLDLRRADIIFAGGAGMKSKAAFQRLYQLAERAGGQVAASRGAVAAGYAPYSLQVGQTGLTVRPKLYVAFGISGAVQHLSGMIDAECIVAVNPDRNAPIHAVSDYSIYADAGAVISDVLERLK